MQCLNEMEVYKFSQELIESQSQKKFEHLKKVWTQWKQHEVKNNEIKRAVE